MLGRIVQLDIKSGNAGPTIGVSSLSVNHDGFGEAENKTSKPIHKTWIVLKISVINSTHVNRRHVCSNESD